MQFLKTAFWVVLAVLIALFSYSNWTPVRVTLVGDYVLDTWLPVVVIISFLAGLVPMWVLHRATRWSMRRRLDSTERALASVKPAYPPPSSPLTPLTPATPGATDEP